MDQKKTGEIIRSIRKEIGMTQKEVAEKMGISDKAVSKWERGSGMPDLSLLPELSEILKVDMNSLISGSFDENQSQGGNMKKIKFYVCPQCGNILTASCEAAVSCCGKRLEPLEAKKPDRAHEIETELIENEYYVTSAHGMTKEHYIDFIAFVSGDTLILKKQYPEWNCENRIPRLAHGKLVWHCSEHGLFYKII